MIQETINLLGLKARDRITGYKGVIASVHFDLYGCVRADVTPEYIPDKEGLPHTYSFDIQRLEISDERVMDIPDFKEMARIPTEYSHGATETAIRV